MDIQKIYKSILEDIDESISIGIEFNIRYDIPETPRNVYAWTNHKGGYEVSWDDAWEDEVIEDLYNSNPTFVSDMGVFTITDLDIIKKQFLSEKRGAVLEAKIQCWLEISADTDPNDVLINGKLVFDSKRFGEIKCDAMNITIFDKNAF